MRRMLWPRARSCRGRVSLGRGHERELRYERRTAGHDDGPVDIGGARHRRHSRRRETTLKCADQIGWSQRCSRATPSCSGKVGLPTKRALAGVRLRPNNPRQQVLRQAGTPREAGRQVRADRAGGMGGVASRSAGATRATETTHLWVTGRRSKKAGAKLARVRGRVHGQQARVRSAGREVRHEATHREDRRRQGLPRTGPAAEVAELRAAWKPVDVDLGDAGRSRHADRAERGAERTAHPRLLLRLRIPHLEHAEARRRSCRRRGSADPSARRRCPSPCRCRASRSRRRTASWSTSLPNSNTIP